MEKIKNLVVRLKSRCRSMFVRPDGTIWMNARQYAKANKWKEVLPANPHTAEAAAALFDPLQDPDLQAYINNNFAPSFPLYILDGKQVVSASFPQYLEWTMAHPDGHVLNKTYVRGLYEVSTVFLLAGNSLRDGTRLFETMVFSVSSNDPAGYDLYQVRCDTYDEAETQHNQVVADLTTALSVH